MKLCLMLIVLSNIRECEPTSDEGSNLQDYSISPLSSVRYLWTKHELWTTNSTCPLYIAVSLILSKLSQRLNITASKTFSFNTTVTFTGPKNVSFHKTVTLTRPKIVSFHTTVNFTCLKHFYWQNMISLYNTFNFTGPKIFSFHKTVNFTGQTLFSFNQMVNFTCPKRFLSRRLSFLLVKQYVLLYI